MTTTLSVDDSTTYITDKITTTTLSVDDSTTYITDKITTTTLYIVLEML